MEKILGYEFALFLQDWMPSGDEGYKDVYYTIGFSKSDTLSVQAQFNENSNKLSGRWSTYIFSRANWRVSAEHVLGLITEDDTRSIGACLIPGYLSEGKEFRVTWAKIAPYGGQTPKQLPPTGFDPVLNYGGYTGKAMFESIEFDATMGEMGGYAISMIGTGPLMPLQGGIVGEAMTPEDIIFRQKFLSNK